jgi:hypothetical protein
MKLVKLCVLEKTLHILKTDSGIWYFALREVDVSLIRPHTPVRAELYPQFIFTPSKYRYLV